MIKKSEEEVRSLYKELMNESEVARVLGVSRQSAYDYRVRHGISYDARRAKKRKYDTVYKTRNEKIIDLYVSGESLDKLADRFKMRKPAINYILLKNKVKFPYVHPSHERNEQIYNLREQGVKVKELADRFKLNRFYVSSMLCLHRKRLKKEETKNGAI
jgi:predicted DNA-binding protein YlxM (UPF0122 family)